jgi:hypothetical protein
VSYSGSKGGRSRKSARRFSRYAGSELVFGSDVPAYALNSSQTVRYSQSEGVGAKTEVPHLSESVGTRMLRLMQQRLQNTALLSTP